MALQRVVTLLTDFGTQDVYGAVMAGVIWQINPCAKIIDLTHDIPPQDVYGANFQLSQAWPHFPADTIHVAVVDPGVGSQRRGVAMETAEGIFVGPDNGIFTSVLRQTQILQARTLTNSNLWYNPQASPTFHGRDIFAPVAAHLGLGVAWSELGPEIDSNTLVTLPGLEPHPTPQGWQGQIQAVDRFGNLISTLPGNLGQNGAWRLEFQAHLIPLGRTYSDVAPGLVIGVVGSHGFWEIAVNQGNAAQALSATCGDLIGLSPHLRAKQ